MSIPASNYFSSQCWLYKLPGPIPLALLSKEHIGTNQARFYSKEAGLLPSFASEALMSLYTLQLLTSRLTRCMVIEMK
jgi:hypothetical protein